jgi:hypothetical protein
MPDVRISLVEDEPMAVTGYLRAADHVDEQLYGCNVYAVLTKLSDQDATKRTFYTNAVSPGTWVEVIRTAGTTSEGVVPELSTPDPWLANFDWIRERQAEVLADLWERDTSLLSTFRAAAKHPAYRGLARLGDLGTTIALKRLTGGRRPLWIGFLAATTDDNPVHTRGDVASAANDWIEWGRERLSGYATVAS